MKWRKDTMDNDMYEQSSNQERSDTRELSGGEKFGWTILGMFVPLLGLILWLVWREDKPAESKCLRNGFIIWLVISIVICVITAIVGAITAVILSTM